MHTWAFRISFLRDSDSDSTLDSSLSNLDSKLSNLERTSCNTNHLEPPSEGRCVSVITPAM